MRSSLFFVFFILSIDFIQAQAIDSILIGSGGGFSGLRNVYKIQDLQAFKGAGILEIKYKERAVLKKCSYRSVYKEAKELLKKEAPFSHPSNTYKFIEIYSSGKQSAYTWGEQGFAVPEEVKELYDKIFKILNKVKFESK